MTQEVIVIRTGSANLASIQAGLRRAGAAPVLTESPSAVEQADHVMLPGVGTLGQTKQILDQTGLTSVIQTRVREGRPLCAVCVGLHLLFEGSEESPQVPGLHVVPGFIRRFPEEVRVPQFGWNRVEAPPGVMYLESGEYYFANSYRLVEAPPGYMSALGEHGGHFVAAFERAGLLACQFHPELSGAVGTRVLRRWLTLSEAKVC
ncbi:MAG: imidazole glycerol phosphate synthase subunit HisH [Myxococcales bacterium]|nr:imidazole glycerol phosphate synthase subunit HisH [Myxococcales bacterium]